VSLRKVQFGAVAGGPAWDIALTGAAIRAAYEDPTAFGTTGSVTGWRIPGLAAARLSADSMTGPRLVRQQDGTYAWAPHNLLLNSATLSTQSITVVVGETYTIAATGTGSVTLSGAATGTLNASSARPSLTVTATTTTLTCTVSGTVTEAQVNRGAVALAYVPTAGAARFAPPVEWDGAAWGVRSEPAGTNLITHSSDLSQWLPDSGGAIGAAVTSPDGTQNARTITFGALAVSQVYLNLLLPSAQRTFSVFARSTTAKKFRLKFNTNTPGGDVASTDQATSTTWARFTFTPTGDVNNVSVQNESAGGAGAVEFWLPQLELGPIATSPIPTFGAAVTRTGDLILAQNLPTLTEGTVVVAAVAPEYSGTAQFFAALHDGSATNQIQLRSSQASVTSAGVAQAVLVYGNPAGGAQARVAFAWRADDFAASRDGGAILVDTAGTVPALSTLQLGGISSGVTNPLRGSIRTLRLIRRRLSNAQLQALTL
jgi:hypothetical protein